MVDARDIPVIWDAFQRTKEISLHRHNLCVTRAKWVKMMGLNFDKAPFFNKQTVKDIISLQFNPGGAVPTYLLAQRGISILTCRPKTAQEVKKIKAKEEARRAGQWPIQCSSMKCSATRKLRQAHCLTIILNCGSASTNSAPSFGLCLTTNATITKGYARSVRPSTCRRCT
jgi:hypothetical protein